MQSSVLRLFTMDKTRIQEGAPICFPKNGDGTIPTFYIARAHTSNPEWMAANERENAKYKGRMRSNQMTAEDWANISRKVFITVLLKGWENFYDANGENIPYNKENAEKYLVEFPELYEYLSAQATDDEHFRKAAMEDDAGNL